MIDGVELEVCEMVPWPAEDWPEEDELEVDGFDEDGLDC